MPLYKRYKQTAFALHVNGYLQERVECVCMCVCSSPRQPKLSEENTAVIIKGTKHWRLKTHERKRKHTSQSRSSQTRTPMHTHTLSSVFCPAKLHYKHAMMLYQSQNGIQTPPGTYLFLKYIRTKPN